MTEEREPDFFLGSNNPPDMAELVGETMQAISDWLAEHPVIETEEDARAAKVFIDRGKLGIKDLEDERAAKVQPLNRQVAEINEHYRGPREDLREVLNEISQRVGAFLRTEERRRLEAAAEARRLLEETERVAREAEARAVSLRDEASGGVVGGNVAAAIMAVNQANREHERAQRAEALAEKETKVKIGGGFTKALSLRTQVTLLVTDHVEAVRALGSNEWLNEAIIKSARAYFKLNNKYPPGIEAKAERRA